MSQRTQITQSPVTPSACPRPNILIVDDEAYNREYLKTLLADDYDVAASEGGFEAIELCAKEDFDLVIMDVLMPEMSGHSACMLLRNDPDTKDIPILFLTGSDAESDELRALEVGGSDFVSRPVNPAILKARVKNLVAVKRHERLLRHFALCDELTGLPNRRYFNDRLKVEWLSSAREGAPFSLALIDVDHFKKYNDHYGHAAGDQCLSSIAQVLNSNLNRPRDFIARIGGEEFACILPETELDGAVNTLERVREAVAREMIPHSRAMPEKFVTVSVGVSCDNKPSQYFQGFDLLASADEALYVAKAQGRNRVSSQDVKVASGEWHHASVRAVLDQL